MGKDINNYSLGLKGVNVDKTPIHLDDEELPKAQNAYHDPNGVEGGIRKRDGLQKINSSAAGSGAAGRGAINLPFPYNLTTTLYAAIQSTVAAGGTPATLFRKSTNGTTWSAESTTPARAAWAGRGYGGGTISFCDNPAMVVFKNKLYYPGDQYTEYPAANSTPPPIRCWDGTVDDIVAYAPYNINIGSGTEALQILAMCVHRGLLYFSTYDGGNAPGYSRVFSLDPETGEIYQVGDPAAAGASEFNQGRVWCLTSAFGRLWAGTDRFGVGLGEVWWISPGGTTWTKDNIFGATFNVHSLCSYKGKLYAGMNTLNTGNPSIYVRGNDGVWAASLALGNVSTGLSTFSGLQVFQSKLYCISYEAVAAVAAQDRIKIRQFDGTTWTTRWILSDTGVLTRVQDRVGTGCVTSDAIYFVIAEVDAVGTTDGNSDGIILRSTDGVTWTEVDRVTNLRGMIGFIKT